jgi:hypothetical protein
MGGEIRGHGGQGGRGARLQIGAVMGEEQPVEHHAALLLQVVAGGPRIDGDEAGLGAVHLDDVDERAGAGDRGPRA